MLSGSSNGKWQTVSLITISLLTIIVICKTLGCMVRVLNTYNQTLAFNSIAAQQAYESVQAQFNELMQGQAFAKQNMLVERLTAQGQVAAMGQAGRSQVKGQQATMADQGLNLAVMREELRSADRNARAQYA